MAKKNSSGAKNPQVGIFWFWKNEMIFSHKVPLSEGEEFGCIIRGPKDHEEYWEELRASGTLNILPEDLREEYFSIPRGRVSYDMDNNLFNVTYGNDISKAGLNKIRENFELPKRNCRYEKNIIFDVISEEEWRKLFK